eukprot:8668193-Pyramimonas_sp.AAC.1
MWPHLLAEGRARRVGSGHSPAGGGAHRLRGGPPAGAGRAGPRGPRGLGLGGHARVALLERLRGAQLLRGGQATQALLLQDTIGAPVRDGRV